MVKVNLTTVSGETSTLTLADKASVLNFIEKYPTILKQGTAVCIDAPLVGVHSVWVVGTLSKEMATI